jgi:hypothetical protein
MTKAAILLDVCLEPSLRAKRSFVAARWIASRSLSSGAHSPDPLARNDETATVRDRVN